MTGEPQEQSRTKLLAHLSCQVPLGHYSFFHVHQRLLAAPEANRNSTPIYGNPPLSTGIAVSFESVGQFPIDAQFEHQERSNVSVENEFANTISFGFIRNLRESKAVKE